MRIWGLFAAFHGFAAMAADAPPPLAIEWQDLARAESERGDDCAAGKPG